MRRPSSSVDSVALSGARSSGGFLSKVRAEGSFASTQKSLGQPELAYLPDRLPSSPGGGDGDAGVGAPVVLWRTPSANTIALASDIDQVRWLQVVAYLEVNGAIDVPLMDSEGYPLISPAIPPLVAVRHHDETGATDRVSDPGATNIKWTDSHVNVSKGDWAGADPAYNQLVLVNTELVREREPIDHWVLRIAVEIYDPNDSLSITASNVLVQILGEGAGIPGKPGAVSGVLPDDSDPDPAPIDNGISSGTHGHWAIWKPYSRHEHAATPTQEGLVRHVYASLEEYMITNSLTIYLNHPNGGQFETDVFESPLVAPDIIPGVLVFGDKSMQDDDSATFDHWYSSTMGRGLYLSSGTPALPYCDSDASRFSSGRSDLYWTGSVWALDLVGRWATAGNWNRQMFALMWGYKDNV